jgi:hypothetical protein
MILDARAPATPRRAQSMTLAVALALLAALPTDDAFALAVEGSIRTFGRCRNVNQVLDRDGAAIVRGLGEDRYGTRELMARLVLARPDRLRCLFWGAYSDDIEARARCRNLLAVLLRCRHCGQHLAPPGECRRSGCECWRPGLGLLCGHCGGLGNLAEMVR